MTLAISENNMGCTLILRLSKDKTQSTYDMVRKWPYNNILKPYVILRSVTSVLKTIISECHI